MSKKIEKPSVVSYDVYDKRDRYQTGYSVLLKDDPLTMAKMALKYHTDGCVKARYSDGTSEQVFPKND